MKILFVITSAAVGGAQRHLAALANDQHRRGNEVRVFAGTDGDWLEEILDVPLERFPLQRTWNPFLSSYKKAMCKVLKEFQPDLVHFHSSHTMLALPLLKDFPKVKGLITIHGLSFYQQSGLKSFLYRWWLRRCVVQADHVHFECYADRDVLLQDVNLPQDKVSVVYSGVDSVELLSREKARQTLSFTNEDIVIGGLGRNAEQKNQRLLLNAFKRLNHPSAKLCLIGHGPLRAELELQAKSLGIAEKVLFVEGNASLLPAFDVFVNTSWYEGMPFVVIEAGYAGLPVVATDVGGVAEVIEHNASGYLTSFDTLDVVEGIAYALTHPEIGQKLQVRIKERFSEKQLVEGMHEVFKKTAS